MILLLLSVPTFALNPVAAIVAGVLLGVAAVVVVWGGRKGRGR